MKYASPDSEWKHSVSLAPVTPATPLCTLCEIRPGDTREHNPPQWLFDWCNAAHGTPSPGFRLHRAGDPVGGPLQVQPGITYPCCSQCNAWMNDNIETPVMEILKALTSAARSVTELTVDNQTQLATWLLKVWIFDVSDGEVPSHEEERDYLLSHLSPPPTHTVWLGRLVEPNQRHPNVSAHQTPKSFGTLRVAWSRSVPMDNLRLFSLYSAQPEISYRAITLPSDALRYLVKIWPPTAPHVPWPPPEEIDGPTHDALATLIDPQPMFYVPPGGGVPVRYVPPENIYEPPAV